MRGPWHSASFVLCISPFQCQTVCLNQLTLFQMQMACSLGATFKPWHCSMLQWVYSISPILHTAWSIYYIVNLLSLLLLNNICRLLYIQYSAVVEKINNLPFFLSFFLFSLNNHAMTLTSNTAKYYLGENLAFCIPS
jgi:hypothetical protein